MEGRHESVLGTDGHGFREAKEPGSGRVEPFIERLYRRLGPRYLIAYLYFWLGATALIIAGTIPLVLGYIEETGAEFLAVFFGFEGWVLLLGLLVAIPRWRRTAEPVTEWLAGARTPEQTLTAWRSARSLPVNLSRDALTIALPGFTIAYFALAIPVLDLSFGESLLLLVAAMTIVFWGHSILMLILDLYLRPLRRDLALRIPEDAAEPATVEISMRSKVLVAALMITLTTGWSVAFAASAGGGSIEELGRLGLLTVAVSLTTSGILILLLARSLIAPVSDLVALTREVASGDLSARAKVTSDDEIGALALSFNRMLAELERATDEVRASRARIVAASDAERRRIERNIHDGAQQRLVALALQLRLLHEAPPAGEELSARLGECEAALGGALEELRELARGLHPAVLSSDGLGAALEQLAARAHLPVSLQATEARLDPSIESTAYFVVSEALANVDKYAQATAASIVVQRDDSHVVVEVTDDGIGGARRKLDSGLGGLADRVEAVGGRFTLESPPGEGTTVRAELPAE